MDEENEQSEEIVFEEDINRISFSEFWTDEKKQLWIKQLPLTEGCFESPINLTIVGAQMIDLPPLEWVNFENPPKKIVISNNGRTVYLNGKWVGDRPYITNGPFMDKYVFSSWHLHWGKDCMEGSEHTIDGIKFPLELHVFFYKASYNSHESALKEKDGCSTLVYVFKLQDAPNPYFEKIVTALHRITKCGAQRKMEPEVITNLFHIFTVDYLMYWGLITTKKCVHYVLWLITRIPIRVSAEQVDI